jgi:hypothetical protein
VHEADSGLTFAEIDIPTLLGLVFGDADLVFMISALHMIKTGGNQMIFEKLL